MQELLSEVGAELVPVVLRAVGALALTLFGTAVEFNALSSVVGGDLVVGAWLGYVGAIALYAGLAVVGPDALERFRDAGVDAA